MKKSGMERMLSFFGDTLNSVHRDQAKAEKRYGFWGAITGKTAHHWVFVDGVGGCEIDVYQCSRCKARRIAYSLADAPKGGYCKTEGSR
jgi:hypothetical protein